MQENDSRNTLGYARWLLIAGVLVVISSPYLLTIPALTKGFNFAETGQIGDTIGGITAPFVNLVGAGLVFLALRAQVQANELLQGQIGEEREYRHIDTVNQTIQAYIPRVEEEVRATEFTLVVDPEKKVKGSDGLRQLNQHIDAKMFVDSLSPESMDRDAYIPLKNNMGQLTEIYDRISALTVIIRSLLGHNKLNDDLELSLRNLLELSFGAGLRDNLEKVHILVNRYESDRAQFEIARIPTEEISELRQLVNVVWSFHVETQQLRAKQQIHGT